jgi:hypothetical protein
MHGHLFLLIHAARKNGAPNDAAGTLQQLPANEFADLEELLDTSPPLDSWAGGSSLAADFPPGEYDKP